MALRQRASRRMEVFGGSTPDGGPFCNGSFWFSNTALVRNTLPFVTMGLLQPYPGSFSCQRTFCVLLHISGKSFSVDTPVPSPRHCGQVAVELASVSAAARKTP